MTTAEIETRIAKLIDEVLHLQFALIDLKKEKQGPNSVIIMSISKGSIIKETKVGYDAANGIGSLIPQIVSVIPNTRLLKLGEEISIVVRACR